MTKNLHNLMPDGEIGCELRMSLRGHARAGCAKGWVMQPFPVVIWNCNGASETCYRDERLGVISRPPDSVAYVIAGELRRSITRSAAGVDYFVAAFSYEQLPGWNFLNGFDIPNELPKPVQDAIRPLLPELYAMEHSGEPLWRRLIFRKKCGYAILDALLSCASARPEPASGRQRLRQAVEYLNAHYKEKFDIDEPVRLTPFSRVHFYRIFKARFGLTPHEYVTRLRVREAARLLLDTDLNAAEVGGRVGWEDQFYFSRIFKSVIGVSPLNYRKNPGGVN